MKLCQEARPKHPPALSYEAKTRGVGGKGESSNGIRKSRKTNIRKVTSALSFAQPQLLLLPLVLAFEGVFDMFDIECRQAVGPQGD